MRFLVAALICLMSGPVSANDDPKLEDFLWVARPIVVFADSGSDPAVAEQLQYLEQQRNELDERDVVILVDTDPAANSALRQKLRPRGFMFVLVSKEGEILLRKPKPVTTREIIRQIDRTPLRRQEIQNNRGSSS